MLTYGCSQWIENGNTALGGSVLAIESVMALATTSPIYRKFPVRRWFAEQSTNGALSPPISSAGYDQGL